MDEAHLGDNANGTRPVTETPLFPDSLFPEEQLPLGDLCERVHGRVMKFLETKGGNENIRSAQDQTRISLGVIGEALERYT